MGNENQNKHNICVETINVGKDGVCSAIKYIYSIHAMFFFLFLFWIFDQFFE